MKWYYKQIGIHTKVRVFMSGANCGNLTFRNEEFAIILSDFSGRGFLQFIPEES
jgi:hypothetical protein